MKFKIEQEIPIQRISDLLCGAFEGGSNYWYRIEEFVKPENFDNTPDKDDRRFRHLSFPTNKGGALVISTVGADGEPEGDEELVTYRLDLESIEEGLPVMAAKYPRHFNNFITECDDSETSDVFLQCCLFGEIIYG
jgi:hypothetical protein